MMRNIHSENTKPEVRLRKKLYALGFHYRLHKKTLPGSPDIVITKSKVAIFVNGCFWHAHGCKKSSCPKTHSEFWKKKFAANEARDILNNRKLSMLGYRVATVWECAIAKDLSRTAELLALFIRGKEDEIEI